mmetsp:Transcript_28737/g.46529  ORF Transcript_28737/g.46529 Transcript_28737/m.46529 type:complete len:110 (+) Transcript_28737:146-475(+)
MTSLYIGSPAALVHKVGCQVCKTKPITGIRYKCKRCFSFDLCESCYYQGYHADKRHEFKMKVDHGGVWLPVPEEYRREHLKNGGLAVDASGLPVANGIQVAPPTNGKSV